MLLKFLLKKINIKMQDEKALFDQKMCDFVQNEQKYYFSGCQISCLMPAWSKLRMAADRVQLNILQILTICGFFTQIKNKSLKNKSLGRYGRGKYQNESKKHILKHVFLFVKNENKALSLRHKPKTIFFTLKNYTY